MRQLMRDQSLAGMTIRRVLSLAKDHILPDRIRQGIYRVRRLSRSGVRMNAYLAEIKRRHLGRRTLAMNPIGHCLSLVLEAILFRPDREPACRAARQSREYGHMAKIVTKAWFHEGASSGVQRLTGRTQDLIYDRRRIMYRR